jgi:Protein of unknown function (DUF3048) N-terminal domain/Protein of unknown function (DUF3048) C-terminal domain
VLVITLGVVAPAALTACSHAKHPAAAVAVPSPSPSPTPTTKPTSGPPPYQWLSGLPYRGTRPVLAVKVDNVAAARPQVGVDAADVVYVEQVEYGLTRLMAVFSSHLPQLVGPVRSARTNDIELLAEYGRPVLAFSGANAGVAADVAHANVVDASADVLPSYFHRDVGREIPHNLFVTPVTLLRDHTSSPSRDVGFRFGAAHPGGGRATVVDVAYPSAAFQFTYDAPSRRYGVSLDGAPDVLANGTRLAATNLILQYVKVHNDKYVDVNGNVSPYSVTTGKGAAWVYREGRAQLVEWSRPTPTSPTRWRTGDGKDITLRAGGQTWVMLVPVR